MKTLQAVKDDGLHINQALALGHLMLAPGMTPSQLRKKLEASLSLTSQLLKTLLKKKYIRVESIKSETGLRQFHPCYYLQPKGHRIASKFTYDEPTSSIPHRF